jgi:hypothetical protein
MTTPDTALDPRYSDPAAVAVPWDETQQSLETAELAWISNVRPDGHPHVTPLVPLWSDGVVYFHTGPGEQKTVNLRANPHVVLTTGCATWDSGLDVVVEGPAVQVTDTVTLSRVAGLFAAKWDGRWKLEAGDGVLHLAGVDGFSSLLFGVTPTKVYAHRKGDPFGATTHRF